MKITVTGSLGNTGKPLVQELVQKGHAVTVITSKPENQAAIEALGAGAAVGSVLDVDFLASALAGADAVYAMVPHNFTASDTLEYHGRVGRIYAQAIRQAAVKRVVLLSSWGAHLDHGTGSILGLHKVEKLLGELPDVALTSLRACSFYPNLYSFVGLIKAQGFIAANCGGDDKMAWVHPRDIAAAAAEELTTPAVPGSRVRYVASDERTCAETARVLGAAIGKPDLQWHTIPDAQMQAALERNGLPAPAATSIVEIYASIHSGRLGEDYEQHKPQAMGRVKAEDFAQEFAAAF